MGRRFFFDWPIFILGLILSGFGLVLVYSATWRAGAQPGFHASDIFIKQVFALAAALVLFHFLRRVKWGIRPESWVWFYAPVIVLLIAVLFISPASKGVTRWIDLGIFKLQPSEIAKVAWVMLLAWLLSVNPIYLRRNYLLALLLMVSMVGLMLAQPDLGTSMVFVFTFFVLCWLAGVPRRVLGITVLAALLLAVPAYFVMHTYQQNRILAMVGRQKVSIVDTVRDPKVEKTVRDADKLDPKHSHHVGQVALLPSNKQETEYQPDQGMIALGSGGLTGKGFLRGTQSKAGFVPEIESDFIFALVGEEFGFAGCVLLLLLFFLLLARILALSRDALTPYERYICYGASAVLLFHVCINVGMTMKLVPVAGVPLPFISQGGSALLSFWALLAVLESIYERSQGEYRRARVGVRR